MIANNRRTPKPQALVDAEVEWNRIALEADKEAIKATVYKGTYQENNETKHKVRQDLCDIYHGKCAYCENKELKPEVEHYRPKKAVTERKEDHPGYYWLCYEWTNLLPSCRYCNTEGGKGNSFPVLDECKRVSLPPIESGALNENQCLLNSDKHLEEQPLLLHPEIDEPSEFLGFNDLGKAVGLDVLGRGTATIDIINLNRDNLVYRRQRLIKETLEHVEDQFTNYYELNEDIDILRVGLKRVFERLEQKCIDTEPFALMARNVRDNFDRFIADELKTLNQQNFAKVIFKEYKDGVL